MRRDRIALAVLLALVTVALASELAIDAPLGHDEAVYAVGARSLTARAAPGDGMPLHRSIGMEVVGAPGVLAGGGGPWLRLPAVAACLAFFLAYAALGRRVAGPWPAVVAAAAMAGSFGLLRRSAELLSDVPSLLLLILAAWLVLIALAPAAADREAPVPAPAHRRAAGALVGAALCALAGFYLRYGVVITLASMAAAAAIHLRRSLWARRRWVLLAVAMVLAGLVPHLIEAQHRTGSPLGILRAGGRIAHRDYLGQGLVELPRLLARDGGPLALVLVLVGLGSWAWLLRRDRARRDPAAAFLGTAAVVDLLVTGLLVHAELRYFFFCVALLVLLGARTAVRVVQGHRRSGLLARVGLATLAAAVIGGSVAAVHTTRRLDRTRAVVAAAGLAVRRAAAERPCEVSTDFGPELAWYSRCAPARLPPALGPVLRFQVVFARDPDRARRTPRGSTSLARIPDHFGRIGAAAIYRVR